MTTHDRAATAVTSEMLARFPDFPSIRGRRPVRLIAEIAQLGEVGMTFEPFARSLLTAGRLVPAIRELAILRVAWLRGCSYIWGGHALIAHDVGLQWPDARDADQPEHALAVEVTDQLATGVVDLSLWARAVETWGRSGLLEFAMVVGQYTLLSMALEVLDLEREPGTEPMPEAWPGPVGTDTSVAPIDRTRA